uniref:Secreted protein n=1 Tax=Rhipicephalus zambeziensis TaxID=60191 RepID=A0A224YGM0_9ACAR
MTNTPISKAMAILTAYALFVHVVQESVLASKPGNKNLHQRLRSRPQPPRPPRPPHQPTYQSRQMHVQHKGGFRRRLNGTSS